MPKQQGKSGKPRNNNRDGELTLSATDVAGKYADEEGKSDDRHWHLFTTAKTAEEFCRAWLALLCKRLDGIGAAVVLLEAAEEERTFVPIAVWPKPASDLERLGAVAERALTEMRGIVDTVADSKGPVTQVSYPIRVADRIVGAVALETHPTRPANVNDILREIHWGIAWLADIFHQRELQSATTRVDRIGSVMETVASALRPVKLQQSLFEVANTTARHLRCSRAAIGLVHDETMKLAALSDAAWFEKNTSVAKHYVAAMEEAADNRTSTAWNRAMETPGSHAASASPLELLAEETSSTHIVVIPLINGVACTGAIALERSSNEAFTPDDRAWIDALAALLPAVIEQKRQAEQGYIARIRHDGKAVLSRLFGPRHLLWKCGAATLLLVTMLLTLVDIDYRVASKAVIEGEVQRVAAAPFEGFLAAAHVRAGDTVRAGQVLCELDDRELKIEQKKWTSERDQYEGKLREAMANRDLTAVQIVTTQIKQAEAQLALTNERLLRAKITAPFDGIVVSGDLSQQVGAPLENGKKLFEIAPLSSYRVILQVDERELRHIEVGQQGKLVISGITGEPLPIKVSSVTPVATSQDGRNFFRVEAQLPQASTRLRPGMEGIGKIETGPRRLGWILTHGFTDWLRLNLWTWLP